MSPTQSCLLVYFPQPPPLIRKKHEFSTNVFGKFCCYLMVFSIFGLSGMVITDISIPLYLQIIKVVVYVSEKNQRKNTGEFMKKVPQLPVCMH